MESGNRWWWNMQRGNGREGEREVVGAGDVGGGILVAVDININIITIIITNTMARMVPLSRRRQRRP